MSDVAQKLADLGAENHGALSPLTSLRVGGAAEYLITPGSREALIAAVEAVDRLGVPRLMMGRGSNLLIRDTGVSGAVIRATSALPEIEFDGRFVRAGASVPLQKLILACAEQGLGGFEYLFSVPGNVGGAIYMNAGRGRYFNASISDYVHEVEYWRRGEVRKIAGWQCQFSYRYSRFQEMTDAVILGTVLRLPRIEPEESKRRVAERKQLVKEKQDNTMPNGGTVFRRNFENLPGIMGHAIGGAKFSEKCQNWILNHDSARADDVFGLIDFAGDLHEQERKPRPELEWRVWGGE